MDTLFSSLDTLMLAAMRYGAESQHGRVIGEERTEAWRVFADAQRAVYADIATLAATPPPEDTTRDE